MRSIAGAILTYKELVCLLMITLIRNPFVKRNSYTQRRWLHMLSLDIAIG
jgi:hypothetical protein